MYKSLEKGSKYVHLDVNNDGTPDIVTGSFHFRRPYSKFGSVDAFLNPAEAK